MLTFQGQAVPVIVWNTVFKIYKVVEACAGCFFHMHMFGITMENIHHFIQSTAVAGNGVNETYQKFTWFPVLVNIVGCLWRQSDAETFVFGRSLYFPKAVTGIIGEFFHCVLHFFFRKLSTEKTVQRLQRIIKTGNSAHISDLYLLFLDHIQEIIFQFFKIHNVVLSGV